MRCREQVLQVKAELLCKQQACQQACSLLERLSSGSAATSSSSNTQACLWLLTSADVLFACWRTFRYSDKFELQAEGNQGCVHVAQGNHNLAAHAFACAYRLALEAGEVGKDALINNSVHIEQKRAHAAILQHLTLVHAMPMQDRQAATTAYNAGMAALTLGHHAHALRCFQVLA